MNKIKLSIVDFKLKRLRDYYRILYDIDMIIQMCKNGIMDKNNFINYQGIIITYRKCFDKNSECRNLSLTEKHLRGLTEDQIKIHKNILNIGNRYVGHMGTEEYDDVIFELNTDTPNKH